MENLILDGEDCHIIATVEAENDVERGAQGKNEDAIKKELKATKDELEISQRRTRGDQSCVQRGTRSEHTFKVQTGCR